MANWNQPLCDACFSSLNPGRTPYRVVGDALRLETCCQCGSFTESGIYVRLDPASVPFPAPNDDDDSPQPFPTCELIVGEFVSFSQACGKPATESVACVHPRCPPGMHRHPVCLTHSIGRRREG